jgi:SAM-dependent methyltransferase
MNRKTFLLSILSGAATAPFTVCCKRQTSASTAQSDPSRAEQLAERIIEHTNTAYFVGAAYIGDRLGLFKAMAGAGPLSAKQLAAKTGLNERYILEWLRTMASARYIDYHPESSTFDMPSEHSAVLVDEDSPTFSAGLIEGTVPDIFMVPRVLAAFQNGKGISYGDYPPETFDATERITKPDYRHLLAQQWLPAIPGAVERLRVGGNAADLGSGAGLASIAIAKAFPQARAFGFEPYAPSVTRARENAQAAGVADRVKFDTFDGVNVPGGPYDLITINYSLHHAGNPVGLLGSTRQALASGGNFLIVEYRKSVRLEEDINTPRGGIYGVGLMECMPTALAEGGPGYGTGITEPDVRDLAARAGFSKVTRVLPEDPMRSFFVLQA